MNDKVFRVELTMEVQPGNEQAFEQAWLEVGRAVAEHPDNIAQWLATSRDAPGRYLIVSDWPDEASFRRFEQAHEQAELTQKLRTMRARGTMETMTVLHHLPGARGP
jgi:heme-degrading monooxygenase HmoA